MNTNAPSHCPRCGSTLEPTAHAGLCPRCLLACAALPTEDETSPTTSAPAPPLEEIAAAFPELEVLELIGRGGMGVVYKARQKSLNRIVALKLLAPERVQDAHFAERFAKEAQALAALSHPNIVTIHDFGHANGFYFLLMEFVDGVNLRLAMSAGRFTPEQALAIVPPVCDALQYAHKHGIVHRDIKPENLLLDKDGRVKIADFGIAKMIGGTHEANVDAATQALGTPRYAAPEQQSNPQHVDHRADIYSLGVVLYELLTGEAPGSRLTPPSQRVQIDVRLDEVVLRALNEKPELRWQTAADLKTQIETLVAGQPVLPSVRSQRQQGFYHVMGYHTVRGQQLLKVSFLGLLCFLGFIRGLEFMRVFAVFFVLLVAAALVEKRHQRRLIDTATPPRSWWHKTLVTLGIAAAIFIPLRAWVIQPFTIPTNSLAPEITAGSYVLVWKLNRHFVSGDIIVFEREGKRWIGRVARLEAEALLVSRNNTAEERVPLERVVGKVVSVFWRPSSPPATAQTTRRRVLVPSPATAVTPSASASKSRADLRAVREPVIRFLRWQTSSSVTGPAFRADGSPLSDDELRKLGPMMKTQTYRTVPLPALQVAISAGDSASVMYSSDNWLPSTLVFDDGSHPEPPVATPRSSLSRTVYYRDSRAPDVIPGVVHSISQEALKALGKQPLEIQLHRFAGAFKCLIEVPPDQLKSHTKLDEFTEILEVAPGRDGGTLIRISCSIERAFSIAGTQNRKPLFLSQKSQVFPTTPGELIFEFRDPISKLDLISVSCWEAYPHVFHGVKLPPLPDAK